MEEWSVLASDWPLAESFDSPETISDMHISAEIQEVQVAAYQQVDASEELLDDWLDQSYTYTFQKGKQVNGGLSVAASKGMSKGGRKGLNGDGKTLGNLINEWALPDGRPSESGPFPPGVLPLSLKTQPMHVTPSWSPLDDTPLQISIGANTTNGYGYVGSSWSRGDAGQGSGPPGIHTAPAGAPGLTVAAMATPMSRGLKAAMTQHQPPGQQGGHVQPQSQDQTLQQHQQQLQHQLQQLQQLHLQQQDNQSTQLQQMQLQQLQQLQTMMLQAQQMQQKQQQLDQIQPRPQPPDQPPPAPPLQDMKERSDLDQQLAATGASKAPAMNPWGDGRCRWHRSAETVGVISEDGHVFTKTAGPRRSRVSERGATVELASICMVFEASLRCGGVHRYCYDIMDGELGAADGVGFVFDSKVRRNNIQRMRSVFLNQRGRICLRNNGQVTKLQAQLPPLMVGVCLHLLVDLDSLIARFNVSNAEGVLCGSADVSLHGLSDIGLGASQLRSGFFCAVVTGSITIGLR